MLLYSKDFDPNTTLGRATLEMVARRDDVRLGIEPVIDAGIADALKTKLEKAWTAPDKDSPVIVVGSLEDANSIIAEHELHPDLVYTSFVPLESHHGSFPKLLKSKQLAVPTDWHSKILGGRYSSSPIRVIRPGISENFKYMKLPKYPPTPFTWAVIGKRAFEGYQQAKGNKAVLNLTLPIGETQLLTGLKFAQGLIYLPELFPDWSWVPRAAARMGLPVIAEHEFFNDISGWGFALKDYAKLPELIEYIMGDKRWRYWHNIPREPQSMRVSARIQKLHRWDDFVKEVHGAALASSERMTLSEKRAARKKRKGVQV